MQHGNCGLSRCGDIRHWAIVFTAKIFPCSSIWHATVGSIGRKFSLIKSLLVPFAANAYKVFHEVQATCLKAKLRPAGYQRASRGGQGFDRRY